jgi:hypothetical protein
MAGDEQAPKIQVDSDWKAQAQAEKQRLAEQAKAKPTAGAQARGGAPGAMPPANFELLVSTLATQALFAMGAIPDPRTGQRVAHLDLARHHIDMLTVLEEKTKGNLSEEESNMLAATLYELRTRYVQTASAARPG